MLHKFKNISQKYYKRVRAIIRYILDYKILLFSLIYVSTTFLFLNMLRNISDGVTMGLFFILVFLLLFSLSKLVLLRNISKSNHDSIYTKSTVHKYIYFFRTSVLLFLVSLISLSRVYVILNKQKEVQKEALGFTDQWVSFEGYVGSEVDRKSRFQHISIIQLQDIFLNGEVLGKNHGQILVKTQNYEKFMIGQVCRFEGVFVEPENFDEFDYKTYLNNKGVFLIMEEPRYYCFETDRRRAGSLLRNALLDLKDGIVGRIDIVLKEPQSSLLAGILFGNKRLFSKDFDASIRMAGVSHTISASGYNITIVLLIINKTLFFVPKKVKIILGLVVIWLFAIFSGLSSSIIRACIMNTLSLIALFWGRGNTIHISLPLTSAVFVFFKPLIILDVGFLLSMSATLGLVYILPILLLFKKKVAKNFKFVDGYLLPTMSCTLSTLPISVLTFKTFSIWSVPINALILPVLEGTMLWGALSILLFRIHRPLSYFFFTVVDLQLKYFEYIVNVVGNLNVGAWDVLNSNEVWISGILLLFLFLFVIYCYPVENEKYNYYLKDR